MSTFSLFPATEETFLLNGPSGQLEVLTTSPDKATDLTAIICHPHPLQQGTMHNKVVTTMARAYQELGMRTVRFNYRGVGRSEGSYGDMQGECEDLRAIINWVEAVLPNTKICLAGFSFGSFISASVAQTYPALHLLNIAPAVNHADFFSLQRPACPWLIVQGDADEIVPAEEVFVWVETLNPPVLLIRMPEVGHFFHGQLVTLRQSLKEHIKAQLEGSAYDAT